MAPMATHVRPIAPVLAAISGSTRITWSRAPATAGSSALWADRSMSRWTLVRGPAPEAPGGPSARVEWPAASPAAGAVGWCLGQDLQGALGIRRVEDRQRPARSGGA